MGQMKNVALDIKRCHSELAYLEQQHEEQAAERLKGISSANTPTDNNDRNFDYAYGMGRAAGLRDAQQKLSEMFSEVIPDIDAVPSEPEVVNPMNEENI